MYNERANCWKIVTHSFVFIFGETCCNVQYVCVYVCLRMYLYGLNTELIDGSSKLDFQTFKIIRQFFVRVLVMRRDATATRRNLFN